MENKELVKAGAIDGNGNTGHILLIKSAEFDSLLLQWGVSNIAEPEQYLIATPESIKMIGDQLSVIEEPGSSVFDCQIESSALSNWTEVLKAALLEQFPSPSHAASGDEETTRRLIQDALAQFASAAPMRGHSAQAPQQAAPQRSLNDYIMKESLEKLLLDQDNLNKLGEHVPKEALASRTIKDTLAKIFRSAEFKNAGDELTRALQTQDYASIFQSLDLPIPTAEQHFKDPVASFISALTSESAEM